VESEINRGISTICILSVINNSGEIGVHGYQISKDLEEQTNYMLIIEEGTLYPLLRKLEEDGLIKSRREEGGRRRKYYSLTTYGKKVFNYLTGFYSKLIEAISSLFDVNVDLKQDRYFFCPMCANKITLSSTELKFCDACGYNFENDLSKRGLNKE
jgi:PadR family transcriptional regulator PadR